MSKCFVKERSCRNLMLKWLIEWGLKHNKTWILKKVTKNTRALPRKLFAAIQKGARSGEYTGWNRTDQPGSKFFPRVTLVVSSPTVSWRKTKNVSLLASVGWFSVKLSWICGTCLTTLNEQHPDHPTPPTHYLSSMKLSFEVGCGD